MNTKQQPSVKLLAATTCLFLYLFTLACFQIRVARDADTAAKLATLEPTLHETTESKAESKELSARMDAYSAKRRSDEDVAKAIQKINQLARDCEGRCHD
jgi:tRNA A-37 threonylcarbamoyl transferase component Bud32